MKTITKSGFTIIELLIVIVIIGILSTVGIVSFANIQSSTRDSQRSSKITVIAEALEKYYSQHGEYPSCDAITKQSISTVVSTTLVGVDPTNLTTPSNTGGTNSFAALATCDPSAINNLSSDVFAYVGNNSTPCLTTSGQTAACLQYTLKYREESTGNTISLVSRHTIPTLATPAAPTTTLTLNGSNVLATITPVTCPVGSITQYGIRNRTNTGSWSSYTPWDTITTATQAANQGVKYEYQSEARCYPDGTATSASNPAVGAVSNVYINPITTVPTVPVVAANTVGATTTWSWGASTGCVAGTVVNYRYNYTISPSGYDSGWVTTAGTSVGFGTSTEGQTYTLAVQAQCYNANTSSSWSASGSANYYRPISTYILTTTAGTGGTVSSGGTYNVGSTPTITATPNASYSFSSWSGDTGCSGVASHTITMDANKACTANFTPTAIAAPAAPTVTTSTVDDSWTTWSWNSASCPGNTARYQYYFTTTYGLDTGWVAIATTSKVYQTSNPYTYTMSVQAQCYNGSTSSTWSGSGSASYTRSATPPPSIPTVTLSASSTNLTVGQSTTLSLISNTDVGPTIYYLKIYDQTTGTYLASAGGGTTLSYTDTPATSQTYVARVTDLTGNTVYSSSSTVTVSVTGSAPIPAPAAPTVTANTSGSNTTWSWNTASCPGNTARYQYDYATSYGYDSGWATTGSTSVGFSTSAQGYTYIVSVQAQCYNGSASSAWSGSGSANYYRPITPTGNLVFVSTIATGANYLYNIAISPDGTSVYVSTTDGGIGKIAMYSRNTSTGALTPLSTPTINVGSIPEHMGISPDGTSLYVTENNWPYDLYMFSRNTSTGALTPLGTPSITVSESEGIVISPNGASVYTASYGNDSIYMFSRNTSTGMLSPLSTPTIDAGLDPVEIAMSPDGTSVYVANHNTHYISAFSRNTSTGILTALVPQKIDIGFGASPGPRGVVVSPDGTSVYVPTTADVVAMFSRNTSTGALTPLGTPTITTGNNPNAIAISADGTSVYTVNRTDDTVSMFNRNTSTGALTPLGTPTIATGDAPEDITISSDGTSVYVINYSDDTITTYRRN